jgi:hypothetical protein
MSDMGRYRSVHLSRLRCNHNPKSAPRMKKEARQKGDTVNKAIANNDAPFPLKAGAGPATDKIGIEAATAQLIIESSESRLLKGKP